MVREPTDVPSQQSSSARARSSRKRGRLPKITSRGTSIDQDSPSTAMAALIAHPDLGDR